ncbi:hypothetical protein SERLA73DRAFT_52761 [Serpula lacrymans var. lacrymans S7.3]|uniref:FAD/NAD(P)-binding domain-containing protein n=2 Tax=Serpula lacrymans var. lacrymans TaxID=341189 RepID=F8PVP3_SERL3|nr:uncharacterized protein SERLADRAFT_348628 [Serpula lacrymans var. lacrymans S7.9]EGO00177.1 hypothetical protein SERLA73DRAFT_52761 [Serpula lacrymans var. lacrymans S7.3]EGO25735.1 hypothetical protein SERLADRAFT_348628 [Serpula lacrymans var. lacrymans S7.9]
MSSQLSLPTLDRLGSTIPDDLDVQHVAQQWFKAFSAGMMARRPNAVGSVLVDDAFWRDMFALTWDMRTFQSSPVIERFLTDQLRTFSLSSFKLRKELVRLERPYPDLAWIQGFFDFETQVGIASGVFRLVPLSNGEWKAHAILTNLEDLKGFPEKIGSLRNFQPNHGKWADQRVREKEFADADPQVVVIGGGQSGLEVAARLKALDVSALVVEKHERIGDNWRKRYEALCLHDPVWYDHMPYLPFPQTWPVYSPALKLADWLESYAHTLELNVWTSSAATSVTPLASGSKHKWRVVVNRHDGQERVLNVNHVVFCMGFSGKIPNMPTYPGMDTFKGQILHSTNHKKALDHIGKKVVVIGACTSAHDICSDYYEHGIDVTMCQRGPTYIMTTKEGMPRLLCMSIYWDGGPPTEIADRINASYPNYLLKLMHVRVTKDIAEADKVLLYGLQKRGFKLTFGVDDSGFLLLAFEKSGGYYLDVGASQLIVDGKIKLKSDSPVARFTPSGLEFENGSTLDADVVIFATGFSDVRSSYREVLDDAIGDKLSPIWGLNAEGEFNSAWREVGAEGIWCMMGNLALCRFHSKHLALQIKAKEEGIFGTRYTDSWLSEHHDVPRARL